MGSIGKAARRLLGWGVLLATAPVWLVRLALAPRAFDTLALDVRDTRFGPPREAPFWRRLRERRLDLLEVLVALRDAARDPRVKAVVLRLDGLRMGLADRQTLRRSLAQVRAAGKKLFAYAEAYSTFDYLLASTCDKVFAAPVGMVDLEGLELEATFLKPLLERVGVAAEIEHSGEYKTAGDALTRESMSAEHREMLEAIADDLFEAVRSGIASGRGVPAERAAEMIDGGPYTAPRAAAAGLLDGLCYPDELEAKVGLALGARPRTIPLGAYRSAAALRERLRDLARPRRRVAVVQASGMIVSGGGAPLSRRAVCTPEGMAEALALARERDDVAAVVLAVDSPGGSGLASDLIWREVARTAEVKPVVACLGDVAASGGYYIVAPAAEVLAEATTLTGSIGVIAGKVQAERLLERSGVRREGVRRGASAGLFSPFRPFTAEERAKLRRDVDEFYARFLECVSAGRKMDREAVDRVGRGRVWTGRSALARGLVDAEGGPLEAIAAARRRAGVPEGEEVAVARIEPRSSFPAWRLPLPAEVASLLDPLGAAALLARGGAVALSPLDLTVRGL